LSLDARIAVLAVMTPKSAITTTRRVMSGVSEAPHSPAQTSITSKIPRRKMAVSGAFCEGENHREEIRYQTYP
jgi:hypothetical protein